MPCPEKFRESLKEFHMEEEIIHQVNEGYEDLVSSSPKKEGQLILNVRQIF